MPITTADLSFRYSGGASNSDPNASLGGVMSSTVVPSASLNNIFDDVSSAESTNGDTEYRCLYVHNAHATLTWTNAEIYIVTNTPSPDTLVEMAVGSAGVGDGSTTGVEPTIASEDTAPSGVTFSQPTESVALALGDIPPGEARAVWIKRVVAVGTNAYDTDSFAMRARGDTAA